MFKKAFRYCIIICMVAALAITGTASLAHPHLEADESAKDTFKENVSDDLIFYVLNDNKDLDKQFRVPAVLRYVLTPDGETVQILHVNQFNATGTNTIWFQNDKHQTQNAPKQGKSSPQAKQEGPKSKTRAL